MIQNNSHLSSAISPFVYLNHSLDFCFSSFAKKNISPSSPSLMVSSTLLFNKTPRVSSMALSHCWHESAMGVLRVWRNLKNACCFHDLMFLKSFPVFGQNRRCCNGHGGYQSGFVDASDDVKGQVFVPFIFHLGPLG